MLKIQAKKEKESDDDDSDDSESEDEAEAMKSRYSLCITKKAENFVKSNLHNFYISENKKKIVTLLWSPFSRIFGQS